MEHPRVSLPKIAPELYHAIAELDRRASAYAVSAGLHESFTHLLRIRASQINKCAYCLKMHTHDALASGETPERISVLPAWRETEFFNEKERAALALTEAVTLIAEGQLPDSVYAQAAGVLSDEEIAAVEWLAIVINAWNRIAISGRTPVRP